MQIRGHPEGAAPSTGQDAATYSWEVKKMSVRLDQAKIGDIVEVTGHQVGDARRSGEIVEILGEQSHPHFRVSWADGTETIFYPSTDATIRPSPA
jgi:Domain of unknown function (DUF1918)